MKITDAKVLVSSPSRNFVTLKVMTDAGLYGLGDATLNGREQAVVAYLEQHLIPCLVGRDPFQTEDIWQYFYRGAYWRRGPVTMAAIGAIDVALWDIKAKALNVPLYQLIGGKSRRKIALYCHANGRDLEEAVDDVGRHIEQGYRAIRVQSGIPGLETAYGIAKDGRKYEPAAEGPPQEGVWSTEKYLNYLPKLMRRVRDTYGDEIDLLHDAHHRLTPVEGARLGKDLEPFHLFWLEDPVAAELQESLRLIRKHTVTPLALGEVFNTVYDCLTLITEQLIDYIRMTIVHGGGITPILKLAHIAEPYHVRTGFHGATDLSPVTMAAALHVNTAINNFGIQEHMPHAPVVDEVFPHGYHYHDGDMYIGEQPGLGVDYNEEQASRYPYRRAYLPVARKEDGTMWDW